MEKQFAVYIMAAQRNGTLYIGVTSHLQKRAWEHREGLVDGFTKEYRVKRLVWYELHDSAETAIVREKRIKKWLRRWKMELIERDNLGWRDLAEDLGFPPLEPTGSPLSRG